jgi:hypothetical protein
MFFQLRTKLKFYQVRFGLSFFICTENQEHALQNQENNHWEISPNDYYQQHTRTWEFHRMSWPES